MLAIPAHHSINNDINLNVATTTFAPGRHGGVNLNLVWPRRFTLHNTQEKKTASDPTSDITPGTGQGNITPRLFQCPPSLTFYLAQ